MNLMKDLIYIFKWMIEIFFKNCLNIYWIIKFCINNYFSLMDIFDFLVDLEYKWFFCSFVLYILLLKFGFFWLLYLVFLFLLKYLVILKILEFCFDDGYIIKLFFEFVLRIFLNMLFDLWRRIIRIKWKYNINF